MIEEVRPRIANRAVFSIVAGSLGAYVLIGSSAAMSAHAAPSSLANDRCADARLLLAAALKGSAGAGDILTSDPPDFTNPHKPGTNAPIIEPTSKYWRTGWIGEVPAPALVRRWYHTPHGSISECFGPGPSKRPLYDVLGSRWRKAMVEGVEPPLVRVSLPAFDAARTHALLLYSWMGRFGGSLELVFLKRTASGWKAVGQLMLIQS